MAADSSQFYAAIFPEHEAPYLKACKSLRELATFVKNLSPADQGFLFFGDRVHITNGPWRYLVYGSEQAEAFDPPVPGKVDKSSGLGRRDDTDASVPEYAAAIRSLAPPARPAAAPTALPPIGPNDLPSE